MPADRIAAPGSPPSLEWYREELLKWGMNFHWHAWEPVAASYDPVVFAEQFRRGGVRTISLEAKCALGWSYYPTAFGVVHPQLSRSDGVFDYFGDRVRVVKENGGRVIVYYCLGMEGSLLVEHPDWRWYTATSWNPDAGDFRLPPHRENTWELTSLFSPYVDEVLLPQLAEIIERYPIDVMWLDIFYADRGHPDYNPYARLQYQQAMGRELLPIGLDPDFRATVAYFRQAGRRVRRHICDHIHQIAERAGREVGIAINWLRAANRPSVHHLDQGLDVDILSCDVVQGLCGNVYELGLQARHYASQGLPSDVISTDFRWWGEWDMKPADVLRREAAITLASGSTYYVYEYAYSHGRFERGRIEHLRQLVDWVAARQDLFLRTGRAHVTGPAGEVTLLVSTQTYLEASHEHWVRECFESLEGASRLLQTTGQAYHVCDESKLGDCLATSRLLVLPHVGVIDVGTAQQIIHWVEAGGKLIVVGPLPPTLGEHWKLQTDPAALQAIYSGHDIEPLQEFLKEPDVQRAGYGYLSVSATPEEGLEPVPLIVWGRFYPFEVGEAKEITGYNYPLARDALAQGADYGAIMGYSAPGEKSVPGVAWRRAGQGALLLCGADVFRSYWVQANYRFHQLFRSWLSRLEFVPRIEVLEDGKPAEGIELVWIRDPLDERALLVHLINLREANQAGTMAQHLPPLHRLRLRLRGSPSLSQVVLLPGDGTSMALVRGEGYVDIELPIVTVHLCLQVR